MVGRPPLAISALTVIDPVTNLAEVIRIDTKAAAHVGMKFEHSWIARYPKPLACVYDQGTEFTGIGFQNILRAHGIERRVTSVKNPQANGVCERLHQSIANTLQARFQNIPVEPPEA